MTKSVVAHCPNGQHNLEKLSGEEGFKRSLLPWAFFDWCCGRPMRRLVNRIESRCTKCGFLKKRRLLFITIRHICVVCNEMNECTPSTDCG